MLGVAVILCVKTGATLHGADVQNGRDRTVKVMEHSTEALPPICSSALRDRECSVERFA